MSESREKKLRYNRRLEFIAKFGKWLESEPPMFRILAWHKWKKSRPVWEEDKERYENN